MASGLGCGVNTLGKGRRERYALLLRIAKRGIAIVFVVCVDIAILGVDIATPDLDMAILGVDIAILGVDIAILIVDIAFLRRQKEKQNGGGGGGREEDVVSRERHFEVGWNVRESVDIRSHKGRGAPCYMLIQGVRPGRGLGCRGIL